jgi:hypothetical protein
VARPRKHDRPTIVKAVCAAIADGALVREACAEHGITAGQIREWASADETLSALYARAREDQAHALAEQAIEIAAGDDALTLLREAAVEDAETDLRASDQKNWYKRVQALKAGIIARDKMRVDALKWMASKIAPRTYGERLQQEISAPEGQILGVVILPAMKP